MSETVAFIGLGDMGRPMAANLVRAGYRVAGHDLDPARAAAIAGVTPAASIADAVQACDGLVVSLVRTLAQTEEVLGRLGEPGLVVAVMSTIDPGSMRRLAAELAQKGVQAVDAPISGGVVGAEAATLTVMYSGPRDAKARLRPLFEAIGKNLFDIGAEAGLGQAVKLANQLMLAVNQQGVIEGLKLAAAYGVSERQVVEVVSTGVGASRMLQDWERQKWEYTEGNAFEIVYKDLRSILAAGLEERIPLPVTALAANRIKDVWGK